MAVGSCINGGSLSNADYYGVSGSGDEWYIVLGARVPVTLAFDVQAFFGLSTPTINNIEIHAWCPPAEVNWEVHNPSNWTPFGTGAAETGWMWFALRGTASAIEFYAMADGGSSWISNPAHNLSPERLAQLRLAPSYVGDFSDGRISKIIAKRGSFTLANMLAETRKLGIAADAADTILYLPNDSASAIDTNQASPSGGSATYKFSNGSHSGTPVDVPGDSPAFADDDSGPIEVDPGRADETDTAFAQTVTKVAATGRADETSTALGLAASKQVTAGRADETSTALGVGASKQVSPGRADELSAALPLLATKQAAPGRADETDVAFGLAASKVVAIGRADETSTAFGATASRVLAPGMAEETSEAFGLTAVRQVSPGLAEEVDTALARPIVAPIVVEIGIAIEIDEAFGLEVLSFIERPSRVSALAYAPKLVARAYSPRLVARAR